MRRLNFHCHDRETEFRWLARHRKKYTPAFKAECVRQVAAGARQSDVARAQGISPALLERWQRQALEAAVPSSAERTEINQLRAALKRVEMDRDMLKKS